MSDDDDTFFGRTSVSEGGAISDWDALPRREVDLRLADIEKSDLFGAAADILIASAPNSTVAQAAARRLLQNAPRPSSRLPTRTALGQPSTSAAAGQQARTVGQRAISTASRITSRPVTGRTAIVRGLSSRLTRTAARLKSLGTRLVGRSTTIKGEITMTARGLSSSVLLIWWARARCIADATYLMEIGEVIVDTADQLSSAGRDDLVAQAGTLLDAIDRLLAASLSAYDNDNDDAIAAASVAATAIDQLTADWFAAADVALSDGSYPTAPAASSYASPAPAYSYPTAGTARFFSDYRPGGIYAQDAYVTDEGGDDDYANSALAKFRASGGAIDPFEED